MFANLLSVTPPETPATGRYLDRLHIGNGGWCRYSRPRRDDIYVRFGDVDSVLRIVELYLSGGVIDSSTIRRVPTATIERIANSSPDTTHDIRKLMTIPGPDLATAVSYYGTTFGTRKGQPRRPHWVADSWWSQIPNSDVPAAPAKHWGAETWTFEVHDPDVDLTLEMPTASPYPDEFYRQVAEVRRRASLWRDPNVRIADANHVNLTTVVNWVTKARKLGYLQPTSQGRTV